MLKLNQLSETQKTPHRNRTTKVIQRKLFRCKSFIPGQNKKPQENLALLRHSFPSLKLLLYQLLCVIFPNTPAMPLLRAFYELSISNTSALQNL